jgi:hypothetical protein
VVKRSVFG